MKHISSGSNISADDSLVGTLSFYESGVVSIVGHDNENLDPIISKTFEMTAEFIFYALQHPEWLIEFSEKYAKNFSDKESLADSSKPSLTLISGGLDEKDKG